MFQRDLVKEKLNESRRRLVGDVVQGSDEKQLEKVDVRTVDGFQGQERNVIVFTAVRANNVGLIGSVNDPNRMNLVLTRARQALVVVGHRQTLASDDLWWQKWIEFMAESVLIVDERK